MGDQPPLLERYVIDRIGGFHGKLIRDGYATACHVQRRLVTVVEGAEFREEVCRHEALLAQAVSAAERVELVAADWQGNGAADWEGRREELERVRVVDGEAIGALEL